MFTVLIATCSSDLIVTLRGGPYSAVTQLRVNPSCKPSFLEVHLAQGGDFLGANSCAPTSSHSPWECIYLSLVPCTWFSPRRDPLMGRICPRVSQRWRRYFTSQVTPYWYLELMALKPPFSSLHCCYEPSRPETSSRCCPLHGLSYPWVSGGNTVDVLT